MLKAQYTVTVIIPTTALFYKIVKDDETETPATALARSLVIEGRCKMFNFFLLLLQAMNLKTSLRLVCNCPTTEVFSTSVFFF